MRYFAELDNIPTLWGVTQGETVPVKENRVFVELNAAEYKSLSCCYPSDEFLYDVLSRKVVTE